MIARTARQPDKAVPFDAALNGPGRRLELTDGRRLPLAVTRWHGLADSDDRWLLNRCHGPTIDLGCGPGRLVRALMARRVPALGVDTSPYAVRHCRARGVPATRQDVFDPLPGEGHWQHVLLADGNVGIGGNPLALLRRAVSLLTSSGTLLLETERDGGGLWRGAARVDDPSAETGSWFPWALVGIDALPALAAGCGIRIGRTYQRNRRSFAELHRVAAERI